MVALLVWSVDVAAGQTQPAPVLTLRAAVTEALQHSPLLLPAQEAIESAQIRRKAASAQFSPRLSPSVNAGVGPAGASQHTVGLSVAQTLPTGARVEGSTSVARHASGSADQRDVGFRVGVSQPLLRGFGAVTRAGLDAAERAIRSAERGRVEARRQLVVHVAQAYFAVVREQLTQTDATRALDRAQKLLDMSEARARVGLATRLDVFRAGLLKSQAQAATLRAQDALLGAREELSVLLGRDPDAPIVADLHFAGDIEVFAGEEPPPDGFTDSNVEVLAARDRLADARKAASVARWNLLPNISLDVNYTRHGLGQPSGTGAFGLLNGWTIGLSSTYAFDPAADTANAAMGSIAVRAAERDLEDAEKRALIEGHRASRAVSRAAATLVVQRTAVDLAGQQRDLATMRYERGLADNLEVIDAETSVVQAQSALIAAEIDCAIARLNLRRVWGMLDPDRLWP
jgi:outer membrane protein TolC